MENTTRIVPHSKGHHLGYYQVEVKRKRRLGGASWERIEQFTPIIGDWNPVLLQYEAAKDFAIRMKDPAALEAFERNQAEKSADYRERVSARETKLYPVDEEVF
jgi:hypothetical protein